MSRSIQDKTEILDKIEVDSVDAGLIHVIIGHRRKSNLITSFPLDCSKCSRETIHVYGEVHEDPTLFFIPIPMGSYYWTFAQCSRCGYFRGVSERVRSLAKHGDPPFRICPKCCANNDLDMTSCKVCNEPLKYTIFPRKGAARVIAIVMTALVVCLFIGLCYVLVVDYF